MELRVSADNIRYQRMTTAELRESYVVDNLFTCLSTFEQLAIDTAINTTKTPDVKRLILVIIYYYSWLA